MPPFYQKEFKKALTQQIAYFLKDKSALTFNVSGNVFFSFEESPKDLKAIKERLKKTIEPNTDPKAVMRFLNLQASLILECVPQTACPFDTLLIPTALSVPIDYANRLGDNPSLFPQEDKSYHNALIKALNKAYYSLMEGLEKAFERYRKCGMALGHEKDFIFHFCCFVFGRDLFNLACFVGKISRIEISNFG